MVFIDLQTARRLERAEAVVGVSFVASRQRLDPAFGASWQDFGGTYAIFDGVDSPFTQTFGLGLFSAVSAEALEPLEGFFRQRGAAVAQEVSPLAGVETSALLAERGYRPIEHTTVLAQALDHEVKVSSSPGCTVRVCQPTDFPSWVEASVAGWGADPAVRSIAHWASLNPSLTHFVVERAGEMIATGSMGVHEGIALLVGASTVPAGRNLGAQGMLLAARLIEARRRGCELAMMGAAPGSGSQRNAERSGFHVAYSRTKWRLEAPR